MTLVVMLDVDGVLVGPMREGAGSWKDGLLRDLGVDPDLLRVRFFAPHWAAIVTGQKAMMPVLAGVLAGMGAGVSAEAVRDYWFAQDGRVAAGVLRDVDALRAEGVPVWLATNQEHCRARYLMEDMGLAAHVEGIVYSAALGVAKPGRGFFDAAAARAGAAACLLVDDTLANVEAARAAGWRAHHWREGQSLAAVVDAELRGG